MFGTEIVLLYSSLFLWEYFEIDWSVEFIVQTMLPSFSLYTFSWSSLNKRPRRSARAFFRICPNSIILFCLSETSLWYSVWKRHSKKKKKSLILQVGNIHTAGRLYLLGIRRQQGIYLSRKKKTGLSLILTIKVKWKRIAEDLKHASFSCFLRFAAQYLFHLSPYILFSRLISLLVLWKTWRHILRHGLGCLRFLKPVEMSSRSHNCRLVNCGRASYFAIIYYVI